MFCDEFMVYQSRTIFARICVEVGATSVIPKKILIDVEGSDIFEQEVIVEWRPPSCLVCKCFSHNQKSCKMRLRLQEQIIPVTGSSTQICGEFISSEKIVHSEPHFQNKEDVVEAEYATGWITV